MGIVDCFGLDKIEYAERMESYSIEQLRIREKKKIRQIHSLKFSVGSSVLAALHTAGASLILGLICCRRASIAQQKLEIIQSELVETRRQAKYEPQMIDRCIPLGVCTCGMCVGCEVHTTIEALIPVPPYAPTGESAIPAIFEHPVQAAVGGTHAFENQGAELIHAATVHSTSATQTYVQLPASVPSSAGGGAGYYTGMRLAPSVESQGADFLSSQIADVAVDKFEKQKYA